MKLHICKYNELYVPHKRGDEPREMVPGKVTFQFVPHKRGVVIGRLRAGFLCTMPKGL